MSAYENHLVSGEALEAVLQDIHGDQQRQDDAIDNALEVLDAAEIAEIWNNA